MKLFLSSLGVLLFATLVSAQAPDRLPVIIDTDIGSDIDDALALALAVASPELDVKAITACGGQADDRAWLVCRFLTQTNTPSIPVAPGVWENKEKYELDWQIQYRRHPAALFNRTFKPVKQSAVELLHAKLKEYEGKLTIICLGPLTNIAQLLKEHPDAKPRIKSLVIMGGAIKVGYDGKKEPEPEWNIKSDVPAAKAVFAAGIPIVLAPLDVTGHLELKKEQRQAIFAAQTPLTWQVQNLYELWDKETPILFDPVAVGLAINEKWCQFEEMALTIDDKGMTVPGKGKANARVAMKIDGDGFTKWYVDRIRAHGKESLPAPSKNLSKFVERTGFPSRVHTFEDYDTDIEKRWWMSGKAESKDVPLGGSRCCRAVLTQDFDDRQGDTKTMYRAVIFNPVPGPPMGPNTRLSFRYKLMGTDKLRVQLYSLTNGYHRYLSLEGVKQNEWLDGTVDMTQMRRPDGSGGPLAENERIDDIQFYVDPRAEVLIDDVILYDAAAEGEKRPFPSRILYTGLFDTGKQGKEWPGDFEIVNHEKPKLWKHAKSVVDKDGTNVIRLNMRGERAASGNLDLDFKYKITGTDAFKVHLRNRVNNITFTMPAKDLVKDKWTDARVSFLIDQAKRKDLTLDEIVFELPKGAELLLDDVLLSVPGK